MSAFATFLEGVRPEIEAALEAALPESSAWPARLHEAMRYSVFAGGKRLRPALVVAAGEAFGAPRDRLLPGAAAVELIHTYSLIHDDLPALDDDELRRGRPTLHRRFNEATAILAGDALLTLGLTRLAGEPAEVPAERRARAAAVVGAAIGSGGMIGGQFEDLESERTWPADAPGALERIHHGKTGALLTACLRLGGIYAGASAAGDAALAAFGESAGLMFQVADDILDVLGDVRELGKTPGKDAQAKKLTYPGLHGLAASHGELASLAARAAELARALPDPAGVFAALPGYLAARDR